ncbi:hypothetical protein CLAFUW4_13679 [Fulvia fulva]|uniref:Uncharacterized protein n=1 Tax=Passalora fulva TaxID=5499 RepID=A0A9Q8PLP1_PASFU|nr:uncharacterized protein CLAFUR5_13528 [Fulvia fulva]KAK4610043.1 hypothetical protein CLAFUR4_13682 [Fulvia fulva]KAK4611220.1 hypothetical protein CLAFUR0_13686 [Fulvia fulva]UJO24768.1 hypothetical protein CLAFUR5_13528 [Fulvia fulva]WPV21981.1 hypothetical protein CLAFUW4_13679 [Fulvia fulva]WPV37168.1 hypothetical protein CLAFUW7_13687 [Fulvia fulva]
MTGLMKKIEYKLSGSGKHDEQGHTIDSNEAEHAQGLSGNHGTTTGHSSGLTDQYRTNNPTTGHNGIGLAQSSSVRHPVGAGKSGSGITDGTAVGSADMPGSFPSNSTGHGLGSGTTGSNIERHSHVTSQLPGTRTSTTTTTSGPHTTTTVGGLTGNHGSSPSTHNRDSTGLTGNHNNTTSGITGTRNQNTGLSGTHVGGSPTTHSNTSGGLTGNNNHGLSHSASSGLTGNNHNTTSGGLTGNNHGLSHSTSSGLTGNKHNTTTSGLTGNNHGLSNTTSGGLTGNNHGVSNTSNYGRDDRDFAGGAAPAGSALSSGHTGQGSHLSRDGYRNRGSRDDRDDYVDNRTTMEKIKDKVVPSRTDRPDDPVTGQNFSQQTGSNNSPTSNYGSGAGAHDEYGSVQGGRGQYPGGERLRENDRTSSYDPYSSRGQQTAADQRYGNENYNASQGRREAGDLGSRSHDVDSHNRRSRDGGVTHGMNDLNLKSRPHSHRENPAAVPTAGGHKVGGVGENSNVYNDGTGRHDQHHYGRDAALTGGAGALGAGAGRHYDNDLDYERGNRSGYNDRDEYVDNRSGMEKLKDKVIPSRTDRPDDPRTGQNYNETNRNDYDNDRSSYDHTGNNRHSLGSGQRQHNTIGSGPTGLGNNVSYMNRNEAETPTRGNPDLVDRYQEPPSNHLGSGIHHDAHLGSHHNAGSHFGSNHNSGIHNDSRGTTGARLGSRDTTGAAATGSVLGHNQHGHNQHNRHNYGRDAALAGGAGALGAGAARHYDNDRDYERGNNYNDRERGLGFGNNDRRDEYDDGRAGQYNDRERGLGFGNNNRRDEYDNNRTGQYDPTGRTGNNNFNNRDEYNDNRTGMEKMKDKILPGRADRPDDPVTGQNYSQQQGNDNSRTGNAYNDSRTGQNYNDSSRLGHNYNDSTTGRNFNDSRTGYDNQSTYENDNDRGNAYGAGVGSGVGRHNHSSSTGLGHNKDNSSMSGFQTRNVDGKRIGGAYGAGYEQGWQDAIEHMQGLR